MVQLLHVTGSGGLYAGVSYDNTVFVTKDGVDATGLRERLDRPFLTIAAGLAAALTGDQIVIGPGTFAEVTLVIPPAFTSLSIIGSGKATTFITTAAGNGITAAGGVGVQLLTLKNFALGIAGAASAVQINSLSPIPYNTLRIENVLLVAAAGESLQINGCVDYYFENLTCSHAFNNFLSTGIARGCQFADNVQVDRLLPSAQDAGAGWNVFDGCILETNLILADQAQVHTLPNTWVKGSVNGDSLVDDGVTGYRVILENSLGNETAGSGDLSFGALATPLADTILKIRCTGLAPAPNWTFIRSAGTPTPDLNNSKPIPGTVLTLNGAMTASMRGVAVESITLTIVGAAVLDRDYHCIQQAALTGAPGSVNIAIVPPFPSANYNVSVSVSGANGMDPLVGVKAVNQVAIATLVAGTGDITITRNT